MYEWPPPVGWGQPGWVPPKLSTGRPEERAAYHRLGRTDRYRWWKPLVALPLILIFTVIASVMLMVPLALVDAVLSDGLEPPSDALMSNPVLDMAALLLTVAVALPSVWFGIRMIEERSLGWVSSVTGRLRWRWLALSLAPIAPIVALGFVAFIVVGTIVEPSTSTASEPLDVGTLVGGLAVIVLLVPVQCAAEEYFFRGFLLQWIGGYLRNPWYGIGITSVLFALAHADLQPARLLSLTAFGVVAAVLALRTGGLEASIALHTVNNLLAFGLGALAGAPPTGDPSATEMPWWMAVIDIAMLTAALAAVLWLAARRRIETAVPAALPPAAQAPQPVVVGSAV